MIINHPLLGPRDSSEFVYLGDANLINRPNWQEDSAVRQFVDYGSAVHLWSTACTAVRHEHAATTLSIQLWRYWQGTEKPQIIPAG